MSRLFAGSSRRSLKHLPSWLGAVEAVSSTVGAAAPAASAASHSLPPATPLREAASWWASSLRSRSVVYPADIGISGALDATISRARASAAVALMSQSTMSASSSSSSLQGSAFDSRSSGSRSLSSSTTEVEADVYNVGKSTNIKWHETKVNKEVRQGLLGQRGCVLWMTGLSGSGKSTLAYTLEHALVERGKLAYVLDGDNVRHGLNKNLGFSAADREENIRRVGEVAKLFADAGVITIVSFISPYRKDRDAARALLPEGDFVEVYMKIPLSVCEQRDPKGLYKLARSGKLKGFTGIDDPYEEPLQAEIVMEVSKEDGILRAPEIMAQDLLDFLEEKSIISLPKE